VCKLSSLTDHIRSLLVGGDGRSLLGVSSQCDGWTLIGTYVELSLYKKEVFLSGYQR